MRLIRVLIGGLAVCLAITMTGSAGATAAPSQPSAAARTAATAPAVPAYSHVVLVMLENHEQSQIIGSSNAPYLTYLARHGANFTNSYGVQHPSQPNYLELFSGSNHGVNDDSCPHTFAANNLGHQLIASHRSFRTYAESLPAAGSLVCSKGNYARRHVPSTDFSDLSQRAVTKTLAAFPANFNNLPTFSWVTPNLWDDMHNGPVSVGDAWVKKHLNAYAQWAKLHNSLLIVTFDEDDRLGGNKIATIFYGAHIRVGNYTERVDHYRVLRTLERMYKLAPLGLAAKRAAITDVFTR